MNIETHLLNPFVFSDTKTLILGSFPPKKEKWSMDFYYPNFQNDMWRIFGLLFFEDKNFFLKDNKQFNKDTICDFLKQKNIGIGDAALSVIRLNDDASDKFLQIVEPLDFEKTLAFTPFCNTLITTGGKSAEIIQQYFFINQLPKIGERVKFIYKDKEMFLYRVPSSSRAYPKSIEYKAEIYKKVFNKIFQESLLGEK